LGLFSTGTENGQLARVPGIDRSTKKDKKGRNGLISLQPLDIPFIESPMNWMKMRDSKRNKLFDCF